MSTKKKFLLILFLFVLGTITIGYYFYNKGPENIRSRDALPVTATELYKAYLEDSVVAQQKFSGKVIIVTGIIGKAGANQQNETIISLKTNEPGAFINCSMEQPRPGLQLNRQVRIKGFCSGMGQGDPDLGIKADVYVTRCWIEE
jgi:hypothetical protein